MVFFFIFSSAQVRAQDSNTTLVKAAAIDFLNSLQKNDFNCAKVLATDNAIKQLDIYAQFIPMMPDSIVEAAKNRIINIVDVRVKDDKAQIKYFYKDNTYETVPSELKLVKKKGKWLIDELFKVR